MRKIILLAILLFVTPFIYACEENEKSDMEMFKLKGIVKNIEDKVEIEVIESNYAFGVYWVITFDETEYFNSNDEIVKKSDIAKGDIIEITYNGQTMMSYPPQIVAYEVRIIEKSET